MKKILLITTLFITAVCFGQTHEFAEEFYKNGIPKVIKTYKESNDKYELVKFISLYENGQKEKENTYKDGKLNGKWTEWHSNGQKSKEGTYKDGLNNGNWTEWYNNGQKKIEEAYKDGKLDGKTIRWYENGQKAIEGAYKDGKLNGKWTGWHSNGQKSKEGTYKDGVKNGYWTNWHDQTEKSQEGTFKDGKREGIWTFWYKHGQKKKEGPYRDGKEDGLWTGWHENGQKSSEKTFKNGESISEECWDEDENVTDQSNFNNKADEKNKMIITEETEVESSPDYKIVNIIGTFDGEEFILSRIHSHPVEGQDDLWERTDIEVKKNESSEDDNVLVDRYFAADFDYK